MSKTVYQGLSYLLYLNPEPEKKCKHSSTAYTEVLKHTIIDTHHPISNSRVQSINDFQVGKVKEVKVPALKCLECGEIIEIKHPMVTSSATTHNHNYGYSCANTPNYSYSSCAIGQYSTALGSASCSTGYANIAIGSGAGYRVNRDKDFNYGGDYSERSLTDKSIIDMGFLDDMKEAIKHAETRQEKALENYAHKQAKLDNIAEKVRQLKNNIGGNVTTNTLMTEIDRIKSEYDVIVSRQQAVQQQAMSRQSNMVNDFIGIKGIKLDSPPPPPPFPQKRKVGVEGQPVYGQDRGYYQPTTPAANLNKFTDIEYVQFLIRNTTFEEKVYKKIKYIDFIFHTPLDQNDSRLNILESGDVLEWVKVPKNIKMGMLSPKIKFIKAIRISVKDLEEARKEQTNES